MTPADRSDVEVRRSARRRKTVSAYRRDGKVIVMIPAGFSRAQEAAWIQAMVERLDANEKKSRSEAQLMRRARELANEYLDGRVVPDSVRWVTNMESRWGSCTPRDASIRLSSRLQKMPTWVQDYVLLHELAHLIEPSHDAHFWSWVDRYPRSERAKGYLQGIVAASGLALDPCE